MYATPYIDYEWALLKTSAFHPLYHSCRNTHVLSLKSNLDRNTLALNWCLRSIHAKNFVPSFVQAFQIHFLGKMTPLDEVVLYIATREKALEGQLFHMMLSSS
ncbi:hypothetical protein Cni_G02813 [Canna indica]|uniref:Uncharacterized protein n=1 Tax=Canna indica TaxID=4628 RepID=A0AAQ3JQS0_9LILI|nr:hypothetical protein Cni_G02813 [Canna indica]